MTPQEVRAGSQATVCLLRATMHARHAPHPAAGPAAAGAAACGLRPSVPRDSRPAEGWCARSCSPTCTARAHAPRAADGVVFDAVQVAEQSILQNMLSVVQAGHPQQEQPRQLLQQPQQQQQPLLQQQPQPVMQAPAPDSQGQAPAGRLKRQMWTSAQETMLRKEVLQAGQAARPPDFLGIAASLGTRHGLIQAAREGACGACPALPALPAQLPLAGALQRGRGVCRRAQGCTSPR